MIKTRTLLSALLLASLASCGSTRPEGELFPSLPPGADFPESYHEYVELKAYYPRLGQNIELDGKKLKFVRAQNLIPVALELGLTPGAQADGVDIELDTDQAKIRLYLLDGTVLARRTKARIESEISDKERDALQQLALKLGTLQPVKESGLRYVFFEGPPGFKWGSDKASISYSRDGIVYEQSLTQTMLSVDVSVSRTKAETLNVGVLRGS